MAEANIGGTYYICTVVSGADKAQMYTVRFANGAQQLVHASFIRTNAPSATPVTTPASPAVVIASQPAAAVVTATPATTGPRFAVNEEVNAQFRGISS